MGARFDLTLDCARATVVAEFWKTALGYEDEPPPPPFATREEWLASYGEFDTDPDEGAWLHDPAGVLPRLSILQVPEPKTVKNRLHIDVRVGKHGTPEERTARLAAEIARLVAAGATCQHDFDGHHMLMTDPEGNEFCVAP